MNLVGAMAYDGEHGVWVALPDGSYHVFMPNGEETTVMLPRPIPEARALGYVRHIDRVAKRWRLELENLGLRYWRLV